MMQRYLLLLFSLFLSLHAQEEKRAYYETTIVGIENPSLLFALKDNSQLISLQNRPPISINALRYRIEADFEPLQKVLKAFSYYDSHISYQIDLDKSPYQVILFIDTGPIYELSSYEIFHGDCKEIAQIIGCTEFTPQALGLEIGKPALAVDIVNAELNLLSKLSECGYPLAYVEKRKVIVDMQNEKVEAASCVQEGPLSRFGPSIFYGIEGIHPQFIQSKILWKEGDIYNAKLVEKSQEKLLKSELFSSVYISHGETLDEKGELPMRFRFSEANHQRISVGASYGTIDGPGFTASWSHRNIGGMGDTLSARGEFSKRLFTGKVAYKRPDFPFMDVTFRAFGEIYHENIHPYRSFIYRGADYIDGFFTPDCNYSVGSKIEHINTSHAAVTGTYLLLGLPFFLRFGQVDSPLDATKGFSIVYSITPYQSLFESNEHFFKQRLTTNFYIPIEPSKRVSLALKIQLGSIFSGPFDAVPITKRFLGGSMDDLRGYRYKTVSPLNEHRKPYGGRSAIFTSAEWRFKVTKTIGIVPFADFGTVTFSELPKFNTKWYKSIGIGARYFSFFGPLRLDVGFPLDRRKGVDPKFQIYATVGQTF